MLTVVIFTVYLYYSIQQRRSPVIYREAQHVSVGASDNSEGQGRPFGSKNGKTYTFDWCQGASRISQKNKIFFPSEEDAKKSGRRLSKLCQQ